MNRHIFSGRMHGYTLVLFCLAVYLPFFGVLPLSRPESMYALIPLEMFKTGTWLTPILNGAYYLDKPPLLYWLNLISYKIFGLHDWAARVPTLAVTVGEVWATYLVGRRLLGQKAAWLGGLVLATCIGFFSLHLQILMDHLISLSLLGSLYFLLRWREEPGFKWAALFHLCLVAGFLSKGFIGVVFPVLIGGLYAWRSRQPHLSTLLFSPKGLTLLALLVIPWFVGVEQAHPGFLKHQIINEQVMRFLGQRQPADLIPFSVYGFWVFLGIWLMPWMVLFPEGIYRFWKENRPFQRDRQDLSLLLIWPAVILAFFTLSSSRVEYYSLPALPPLALILGWRVQRYLESPRDRQFLWAFLFIALLGVGILFLLPHLEKLCENNRREFIGMFNLIQPLARPASFLVPALALVGGILAWKRLRRATVAMFTFLALTLIFLTFETLYTLSPHMSDKLPGEYILRHAAPEDLVIMEQIEEFEYGASFAFYGGRHILMVTRNGLPKFPFPVSPQQDYLIAPEQLEELWQGPQRVYLLVDDAISQNRSPLPEEHLALAVVGKRLLVNRP